MPRKRNASSLSLRLVCKACRCDSGPVSLSGMTLQGFLGEGKVERRGWRLDMSAGCTWARQQGFAAAAIKVFHALGFVALWTAVDFTGFWEAGSLPKLTPHPVPAVPPTVLEIVHGTPGDPFLLNAYYGTIHYLRKSDIKRQKRLSIYSPETWGFFY